MLRRILRTCWPLLTALTIQAAVMSVSQRTHLGFLIFYALGDVWMGVFGWKAYWLRVDIERLQAEHERMLDSIDRQRRREANAHWN